jgi:hypothetical protein
MIIEGKIDTAGRAGVQDVLAYSTTLLAAFTHSGTIHQYEADLPSWLTVVMRTLIHAHIQAVLLRYQPLHYQVVPLHGMNELYVACPGAGGSDQVFETDHVDGPFWWLPGVRVYRCIVGVSDNVSGIQTRFPDRTVTVHQHTFVAFDYNRDVHHIYRPPGTPDAPRVTLKLHYMCYAPWLPRAVVFLYAWLHVAYNTLMRRLFLSAQMHHRTWYAWVLGFIILQGTVAYRVFLQ